MSQLIIGAANLQRPGNESRTIGELYGRANRPVRAWIYEGANRPTTQQLNQYRRPNADRP